LARRDPHNRSRFWQDKRLPGLSLLSADFTTHSYAPHLHDEVVVAVTENGGALYKSRGRSDEVTPDCLLVFNPGEPHSGSMGSSSRWLYRGFYVDLGTVQTLLDRVAADGASARGSLFACGNRVMDPALARRFRDLHAALEQARDPLLQDQMLVDAFARLVARRSHGTGAHAQPPRGGSIGPALDLINDAPADPHSLTDLASVCGLTERQVIAAFKAEVGLTPYAFLIQRRLRVAMQQMRCGLPIAEAATDAGFYDQSGLTRHFKRSFGITPQQWISAATT